MAQTQAAENFLRLLRRAEQALCLVAFAVLATALFLDLTLRELAGNGLVWARQTGVYAGITVAMLGIGLASAAGEHLRPRFADRWLPRRWEPAVVRLAEFTTALVCLLFGILAGQMVAETAQLQEISTVLRIPVWPVQALIPLAFAIAFLRHLLYGCLPALRPQPPPLR